MNTRYAQLKSWLALNGISQKVLADALGVSPSMVSKIIKGDRAPKLRLEQLIAYGIPAELLPDPSGPVGRPLKKEDPK